MKDTARTKAQQLAHEFMQRGDVTGWFEPLYAGADGDAQAIPWADMAANPNLVDWMERHIPHGEGRKALVIGCGLGDDAEELASRGFEVVACDIAPTAINWCHRRFPTSQVQYVVADACDLPASWQGTFDFVLEAYTPGSAA